MTVREANQEAAREPFSNDKQQTGMGVDLIGELLDKGHRLRQAMAVTSQDEDNEHLLPTHIESRCTILNINNSVNQLINQFINLQ